MKSCLGIEKGDSDADEKASALAEFVLWADPDHFGTAGAQDAHEGEGDCRSFDEANDLSGRQSAERHPAGGDKYIPVRMQVVTKKNIYLRDNHTCQYCSRKFHASELTLDHVLPRSRGGRNTWENLVTACRKCNQAKDSRTPEEAGMKLLHRVIPASVHTARGLLRSVGMAVEEWAEYLFVDSGGDKRFVALEA
jgi:HNH endonuclease